MNPTVSSIKRRGVGYLIEVTQPTKIWGLFSHLKKALFFCGENGCVDCKKYQPVKDQGILNLLTLAYNNKKKQDNV